MSGRLPVSLVIPTIGRVEPLRDCLRSVAAGSALPAEVLLVDQSRADAVAAVVAHLPSLHTLLAIGGFDEAFARAAEDGDLYFRWLGSGRTLRHEPAMTVWHRDWRSRDELRGLNVPYTFDQGRNGKHVWRGDWAITPFVARDAREAVRLIRAQLLGRPVAASDWRHWLARGLPAGLVVGLAQQARQSLRQAGCP